MNTERRFDPRQIHVERYRKYADAVSEVVRFTSPTRMRHILRVMNGVFDGRPIRLGDVPVYMDSTVHWVASALRRWGFPCADNGCPDYQPMQQAARYVLIAYAEERLARHREDVAAAAADPASSETKRRG